MRAFDMIAEAQDLLNDPSGDLFTQEKLLRHLNRALRDVSSRARMIREVHYRQPHAGQSVYHMPDGFLGNDKFSWLAQGEWYPLWRRSLSMVEYLNNSDVFNSWRPFYYDVWGRVREERIVANVIATSASAADVFRNPDFPTFDQTFGFKFTDGLRGIDAIRVGDRIINMTDGSEGFVTERRNDAPGTGLFAYERLPGSKRTGDDFGLVQTGDFLRITAPSVSGYGLRIAPPPSVVYQGEESLWMYYSRRHYEVTQSHIDEVNDNLELDIELETVALECFLYWCRREEVGASDNETIAQKQLYEGAYHSALPYIRQRNRDHESTWGSPSMGGWRQSIGLEGISTSDGHAFNISNVR